MPNFTTPVPNMVGGVSQQPPAVRFPHQCEEQINGLGTVVDGLKKRPPTEHVKELLELEVNQVMTIPATHVNTPDKEHKIHFYRRDTTEQYAIVVGQDEHQGVSEDPVSGMNDIQVFDLLTGEEKHVNKEGGANIPGQQEWSASGAGGYLNTTNPSKDIKMITINDFTFILNKSIKVEHTIVGETDVLLDDVDGSGLRQRYGLFHIKKGDYGATYTVSIIIGDDPDDDHFTATKTTLSGGSEVHSEDIRTDDIIAELVQVLKTGTTIAAVTDGTGGCVYSGFTDGLDEFNGDVANNYFKLEQVGATCVVRNVVDNTNDDVGYKSFHIETTDSIGDTVLKQATTFHPYGSEDLFNFNGGVEHLSDLPLICRDGFRTKISGNAEDDYSGDGYWVVFKSDEEPGLENNMGKGSWEESMAPIQYTKLNWETMPHLLIRRSDGSFVYSPANGEGYDQKDNPDGSGKVNVFLPTWTPRTVGVGDSFESSFTPDAVKQIGTDPWPAFDTTYINDIFYFKDRLGFISGETVSLSEAGHYFNFFRTTVIDVLDTDRITVQASHAKVNLLRHAIPISEQLVLFSDTSQFILKADGALTPSSVNMAVASEYESMSDVRPVASGKSIVVPTVQSGFTRITELYDTSDMRSKMEGVELSATIPHYIKGTVLHMAICVQESMLVVTTDAGDGAMYVYKYFDTGGKREQSAWCKFTLGGASTQIKGMFFIESKLYMVIQRTTPRRYNESIDDQTTETYSIETMDFAPKVVDGSDSNYVVALDRRVSNEDATVVYNKASNSTRISLPYAFCKDLEAGGGEEITDLHVVSRKMYGGNDVENLVKSESSDNLSEEFEDWTTSGSTVTDFIYDKALGPLGRGRAQRLVSANSADEYVQISDIPLTEDVNYSASLYIKNHTTRSLATQVTLVQGSNVSSYKFTWSTDDTTVLSTITDMSSSAGTQSSANFVSVGDGWYRVWITYFAGGAAFVIPDLKIYPSIGAGGSAGGVYVWGVSVKPYNVTLLTEPLSYDTESGTIYPVTSDDNNKIIYLTGDLRGIPLWVGEKYTMKYTFSEIHTRSPSASGGTSPVLSGRQQVKYGTLMYDKSGFFTVNVTPDNQDGYTYTMSGNMLDEGTTILNTNTLDSGRFRFPVMARNDEVVIDIQNDTPFPSTILAAEWESHYYMKGRRTRN